MNLNYNPCKIKFSSSSSSSLSLKFYCAYTPSNGAMALLNKISVFYTLSLSVQPLGIKKNDS